MAKSSQAKATKASACAADVSVLGLVTELGHAAYDDGVHSQQFADLRGRRWIGPVAVRKILLGQYLVERFALNHRVAPILHQVSYEKVGYAFTHVHILPKQGRNAAVYGGIVKVEDGNALFSRRRGSLS